MFFQALWAIVAWGMLGCEAEPSLDPVNLGNSPPNPEMVGTLSFEPVRTSEQVEPVTAVEVALPTSPSNDIEPYLIEGPVSQASIGKLMAGEMTAVVEERVVPAVARATVHGWRIRPEVPLRQGQTYSVVSRYGAHGSFSVGISNYSPLNRIWPLPGAGGAVASVYCGPLAPTTQADIALEGTSEIARALPGLNDAGLRSGSCVRLVCPDSQGDILQPLPTLDNYSLDPATLPSGTLSEPIAPIPCNDSESNFGVGCASARPGAIIVRPPAGSQLWAIGWHGRFHLQFSEEGRRFVIPELGLERQVQLSVSVFDAAGRQRDSFSEVSLPPAQAQIVINEVMANPLGPEPTQEWIELLNAGTAPGDLSQLSLRDSEDVAVSLPSGVLDPGRFALLVREDFDLSAIEAKNLASNFRIFRLAHLSTNGLSNSGEKLMLVDSHGGIVSTFPAMAAKLPGVSIARRNGWALDEDPNSFSSHADPGSSPGAANTLAK